MMELGFFLPHVPRDILGTGFRVPPGNAWPDSSSMPRWGSVTLSWCFWIQGMWTSLLNKCCPSSGRATDRIKTFSAFRRYFGF
jgi:hypothetical protein